MEMVKRPNYFYIWKSAKCCPEAAVLLRILLPQPANGHNMCFGVMFVYASFVSCLCYWISRIEPPIKGRPVESHVTKVGCLYLGHIDNVIWWGSLPNKL